MHRMSGSLHCLEIGLIKWLSKILGLRLKDGVDTNGLWVLRIHCSEKIVIWEPSPTLHVAPFWSNCLPQIILRHSQELEDVTLAFQKLLLGQYLPRRTWLSKDCGFEWILHAIFASRDWFMTPKYWNLWPPFPISRHWSFHCFQQIPHCWTSFHKNWMARDLTFWRK